MPRSIISTLLGVIAAIMYHLLWGDNKSPFEEPIDWKYLGTLFGVMFGTFLVCVVAFWFLFPPREEEEEEPSDV